MTIAESTPIKIDIYKCIGIIDRSIRKYTVGKKLLPYSDRFL